jgi:hypothetical protein
MICFDIGNESLNFNSFCYIHQYNEILSIFQGNILFTSLIRINILFCQNE